MRLLIHFVVDLIQLHWSEIKGVGYWIWGWLVGVVGFRTGVRNFIGAGLGFWESTFVFLDLGLLWGTFFGVLWLVTLWYVWFQGVIISFLLSFLSFLFFSLECRASGGVLRYLGSGESHHATTQTCTNTNHTVCVSHPVHTSPFAMSFVWFLGPQFAQEHYLQQNPLLHK